MPSSHLILCRPLLLLPLIPPSIRVFFNESAFASGNQSIGVSASVSVLPMNTQDWSPLGWTGWISLQSKGLLLLLPSIFPSTRIFSNELALHIRWPEYWSFSFSISPSNEHSGLLSFRIDLFDLLATQETLKSLLQHHSSKASILQHSAFFIVQLSHPYMTTGKTIALIRWTFVGNVSAFEYAV